MKKEFDPKNKGGIVAMKIYFDPNDPHGATPYACCVFSDGTPITFVLSDVAEREKYLPYVNAYTLIYDERPKKNFEEWIRPDDMVYETYVDPKNIWPTCGDMDWEDLGEIEGYVRGYNVEVKNFRELGVIPTGRVSFRGYGKEHIDGRDIFIHTVTPNEIRSTILTIEALRMVADEDGYIEEQTAMNLAKSLAAMGFTISIEKKENNK